MKNYIVAYDVFNVKRLAKVRKIVYGYALGGQKSALEVPLSKKEIKKLHKALKPFLEESDRLNVIRVKGKPILLGKAKHLAFEESGVIVL